VEKNKKNEVLTHLAGRLNFHQNGALHLHTLTRTLFVGGDDFH
jgi:hypothetical protein